jgi:ClpA/ClpB-like protein
MMFDKFTKRARKVLALAQEEAQQLNHNYIGTEHLLLGLVAEGEGLAAKTLQNLGIELATVRRSVEGIVGRGDRIVLGEIGMTPRAKKVVELAREEARRLGHNYIGTEHLLLGLIREGEGIAAGALESLGVSLDRARIEILRALNNGAAAKSATQMPAPKNNVVTCRLDDAALGALDALVEAGIRSTRSDAAAWLISAGIEAHRPLFERVNTTVDEIRKLRLEARDIARQVARDAQDGPPSGDTPPHHEDEDRDERGEGEIPDPEDPEDLDELGNLDEPPTQE